MSPTHPETAMTARFTRPVRLVAVLAAAVVGIVTALTPAATAQVGGDGSDDTTIPVIDDALDDLLGDQVDSLVVGQQEGSPSDVATSRLAGEDRFETAAEIALDKFSDTGAARVIVATGEDFPDALAANYLAGQADDAEGAPVLLVGHGFVPEATSDALQALDTQSITLLGGTAAISNSVESELADDYAVDRVAGDDRFDTAAQAARAGEAVGELDFAARTAVLATGENFPDAISAGPLAVGGEFPMLLTAQDALPPPTEAALAALQIDKVLVIGGGAAVSPSVRQQLAGLGYDVEVLAGSNRLATASEVARFALDRLGFARRTVSLGSAEQFPDALTGGPHAGLVRAGSDEVGARPVLLSLLDEPGQSTRDFLESECEAIFSILLFGGTEAISQAAEDAAADAASC